MSTSHNHGRRRAQPVRRSRPVGRLATVAVAGALIAGAGMANAAAPSSTATIASAPLSHLVDRTGASSAVKAPAGAAIDFARISVDSSSENTTNVPQVSGSADSVKPLGANGGPVDDPATAQKFAAGKLSGFGWGAGQMDCLVKLWNRESDWKTTAENPSSLAYGIAQSLPASKMDSVAGDWRTNYQTQIVWGLGYIKDTYGSPCGAWDHETSIGWY